MATLTGVKPGEGWRPVNTIPDHPAVVRIHGFDERIGGMRHIGSGFLIGNIQNRWPIVATAAHVIQEMDKVLGLRPRVPPALDIKEAPSGEATRERMDRIRGKIKDRRRAVEVQDRRIGASAEARYNDTGGILRGTPGEYQSDTLSSSHCQDSNGRRNERGAGHFSSLTSVLAGRRAQS
jgi:hypothetical protein